jgi:hypothetical protein
MTRSRDQTLAGFSVPRDELIMDGQKQDSEARTGTHGGDDGAIENERVAIQTGEDPGIAESPPPGEPPGTSQAGRKRDEDLKTGEENPGE